MKGNRAESYDELGIDDPFVEIAGGPGGCRAGLNEEILVRCIVLAHVPALDWEYLRWRAKVCQAESLLQRIQDEELAIKGE